MDTFATTDTTGDAPLELREDTDHDGAVFRIGHVKLYVNWQDLERIAAFANALLKDHARNTEEAK